MTLNASGPISIGGSTTGQSINLELGRAAGATSLMGETALRTLAGVASGAIDLQDFYGKSAAEQVTFGAAGTGATTDTDTISIPYPSGIVSGHFLLLHAATGPSVIPPTLTGWTLVSRNPSFLSQSVLFWKVADGTETGNQDIIMTLGTQGVGRIYRFSHGSGIEQESITSESGSGTTIPCRNLTTQGAKRIAIQIFAVTAVSTTFTAVSGESGVDYIEAIAEYSNSRGSISLQIAEVPTATAITGGSTTLGASVTGRFGHGFAIIP